MIVHESCDKDGRSPMRWRVKCHSLRKSKNRPFAIDLNGIGRTLIAGFRMFATRTSVALATCPESPFFNAPFPLKIISFQLSRANSTRYAVRSAGQINHRAHRPERTRARAGVGLTRPQYLPRHMLWAYKSKHLQNIQGLLTPQVVVPSLSAPFCADTV